MIRSHNGNAIIYSSYWRTWSRILFHDAGGRGCERMRIEYGIPKNIKTIEVDLTACNEADWAWKVPQINIRCHATGIGSCDVIRGGVPVDVVSQMRCRLDEAAINMLIHTDLLPYIDFDKYKRACNGGAPLAVIMPDTVNINSVWPVQNIDKIVRSMIATNNNLLIQGA